MKISYLIQASSSVQVRKPAALSLPDLRQIDRVRAVGVQGDRGEQVERQGE